MPSPLGYVFMVRVALKFLEGSRSLENSIIDNALNNDEEIDFLLLRRHLPPAALNTLMDEGPLFQNEKLLFYHSWFGTFNIVDTVYITIQ